MTYYDIGLLAQDPDFMARVVACVAVESQAHGHGITDPDLWAAGHRWVLAGTPGFGDAYSSALVAEVEQPGRDQGVITDQMILAAVQPLLTNGA